MTKAKLGLLWWGNWGKTQGIRFFFFGIWRKLKIRQNDKN